MLHCFSVVQDPHMLVFFTDQDLSTNNLREIFEQQLAERVGIKCVVIDCCDPLSEAEQPCKEADYLRKMLDEERKEHTSERAEYRRRYRDACLKFAVIFLLSFCFGLFFPLFLNL